MKTIASAFVGMLLATSAMAQSGTNVPPGVNGPLGAGVSALMFSANTDPVGFNETALSTTTVAGGTTQATATMLPARANYMAAGSCAAGGLILPAVSRYTPITVVNRSGAACTVYPTLGATVESAAGTSAAVNVAVTVASNADVVFRPVLLASGAVAWLQ